jgi:hypothetical protein
LVSDLNVFEDSVKNFVGGYFVVIIKVIIGSGFSVDMKRFYCVFFLELYYLHNVVDISKRMHVFY